MNKRIKNVSEQIGRLMIEMLGVLAIIGVLSIGGIAGFSKAMYNHKLNKQAEQISHIIQEIDNYHKQFTTIDEIITHVFYALGAIPKEMQKNNNTTYFYDVFDNQGFIYCRASGNYCAFRVDIRDKPFDQCKNILEIAKIFHESLWIASTVYEGGSAGVMSYGDAYCSNSYESVNMCLKNLTPITMNTICKSCENQPACNLMIAWKRS